MRSLDSLCPRQCRGFLQALHGKNKLLNHEQLLRFGRMFQPRNWLTLHVSLSPVNRTVKLDILVEGPARSFASDSQPLLFPAIQTLRYSMSPRRHLSCPRKFCFFRAGIRPVSVLDRPPMRLQRRQARGFSVWSVLGSWQQDRVCRNLPNTPGMGYLIAVDRSNLDSDRTQG